MSSSHLAVYSFNTSTISSRLFCCLTPAVSPPLLNTPPTKPRVDRGEYRLEYMPPMRPAMRRTGPAHCIATAPYKTTTQKATTSRKLSQGSPLDQVISPRAWLSGSRNGCEKARARVISGGVAISKGDFWPTTTIFRRADREGCEGEKVAIVASASGLPFDGPAVEWFVGEAIKSSQGVSASVS